MRQTETVLTGITLGESPRWHDDRLWFCDWGTQEIISVDPGKPAGTNARHTVLHVPTSMPFSIDWLPDGRMLVVSGPERTVLVHESDGSLTAYADLTGIVGAGDACNEIVVDTRGNAYVNGGGVDRMFGNEAARGVIALVTPDGHAQQVADDIDFGNGMVVTPDNTTLLIAESYGNRLTAFDIAPDGTLHNRRVWADLGGDFPDGICLDAEGSMWFSSVPQQRCVRVREGGEMLAEIRLDRGSFACAIGGDTLFMLAAEWHGLDDPSELGAGNAVPTGQLLSWRIAT